jgi:hypothetical protein
MYPLKEANMFTLMKGENGRTCLLLCFVTVFAVVFLTPPPELFQGGAVIGPLQSDYQHCCTNESLFHPDYVAIDLHVIS